MQELPLIDVRALDGAGAAREHAVDNLKRALSEIGFVALAGHGIGPALLDPAYAALRELFALPAAIKLRYTQPDGAGARGYTAFGVETARDQTRPDLKEFWHVGRELDSLTCNRGYPPNLWPAEAPSFRPAMRALYQALDALAARMLEAIALGLGLAPDWFVPVTTEGNTLLRALHYPPIAGASAAAGARRAAGSVRAAAHEDINLITLLVTSAEPGLEIKTRTGAFVPVATRSEHVVMNVGDMLSRLTNEVLPSTTHRVVNPEAPWSSRSRYALPFFVHPISDFEIASLPSCVSRERPDRFPAPILAGDFLRQRLIEIGLVKGAAPQR